MGKELPTELEYLGGRAEEAFWQKYEEKLLESNSLDEFQRAVVSIGSNEVIEFPSELPEIVTTNAVVLGSTGMIQDFNQDQWPIKSRC